MTQDAEGTLIGRCYTRAQRIPLMIGRLPGANGPLWGGPYTLTQFVVACAALAVLWQTRIIWAHLGVGWNGAVLLGVPALLAWVVRRARIEGRDPLKAAAGIVAFLAAPAGGRLSGTAWRPPRLQVTGRCRFFMTPSVESPARPAEKAESVTAGGTGRPATVRPGRAPGRATAVELLLAAARAMPADDASVPVVGSGSERRR